MYIFTKWRIDWLKVALTGVIFVGILIIIYCYVKNKITMEAKETKTFVFKNETKIENPKKYTPHISGINY